MFPLVGSVIGEFYWLFLWNFKEIKHQPFSMTQPIQIYYVLMSLTEKLGKKPHLALRRRWNNRTL